MPSSPYHPRKEYELDSSNWTVLFQWHKTKSKPSYSWLVTTAFLCPNSLGSVGLLLMKAFAFALVNIVHQVFPEKKPRGIKEVKHCMLLTSAIADCLK